MQLTGLDLGTLIALLLASTLVLLWLHTRREPPRRVLVASLSTFVAQLPAHARPSTRRLRVHGRAALVFALAIALLLVLALGAPVLGGAASERTLLILIDPSPSMTAHDVAPSRLAVAKQRALALIAALGPHDRAAIATLERRATPHTALTSDHAVLARAVEAIAPSPSAADLVQGARLARTLLAGQSGPQIVLFSDGDVEHADEAADMLAASSLPLRHDPIGETSRNVAITTLAARRDPLDPLHQQALIALHNFGDESESVTLSLHADGAPLASEVLTLAPHAEARHTVPALPMERSPLEARIALAAGDDALASDDRAVSLSPTIARRRVLCVATDDRYLEAALLLDETLDVVTIEPAAYQSADGFDAVIFDRTLPAKLPQVPALYLGPGAEGGAFPLARRGLLQRPFIDVVAASEPLVHGLALSDVNIAQAIVVDLEPDDRALAATATGAPLIATGRRAGVRFVALTFDALASDLPLRAAFPLLVLRALDHLAPAPVAALEEPLGAAREGALAPRSVATSEAPAPRDETHALSLLRPLLLAALALLVLEWLVSARRQTA